VTGNLVEANCSMQEARILHYLVAGLTDFVHMHAARTADYPSLQLLIGLENKHCSPLCEHSQHQRTKRRPYIEWH
jgi:hypothetical protein